MQKKIVWLEDHFKNFSEIAKLLEKRGFSVQKVATQEEFEVEVEDGCDLAILDNKIGERHSVGQRLIDRLSASKPARLLLFSAYLPASKGNLTFERSIAGGHVGYLSKSFSEFDTIRNFWEHSASIIYKFFTLEDPTTEPWNHTKDYDAFSEFESLSLSQKGERFRQAATANRELLEELWQKGALLVILPGGSKENFEAYYRREDIPEHSVLLKDYKAKGVYPYAYSNEYSFDDTKCHAVDREGTIRVYPRVSLGLVDRADSFHFDTGADTSIFCEDYLNEIGGARILDDLSFPLVLRGKPHAALKVSLSTFVRNPAHNGFPEMEPVEVVALMVDSWQTSRLQVKCSTQCENKDVVNPNCIYRRYGLVGRDIYTENDLQVLLSADDPQIAVKRRS